MINNALYLKLKGRFPNVTFGDNNSLQTTDVNQAVFFEFPFKVRGRKVATITISLAETGTMKILRTQDDMDEDDDEANQAWFDFLRDMRKFAKSRLLNFQPMDPVKGKIQKKDYDNFAADKDVKDNAKDSAMTESTLYGSTKSSYQKLENTKLIIRHSKRIEEDNPNNRTRNISALFIESENGERFRYPFIHLAGARAMCRHAANGGSAYDDFGQYIVSLSENIYNLRRFNHLVNKTAFLENTEIASISESAKEKAKSLKKVLESIKRQHGYEKIKEAFIKEEKKEVDEGLIEELKEKFTLHQFNEELMGLFPYITDLLGEAGGTAAAGELSYHDDDMEEAELQKGIDYDDKDAAQEPIGGERNEIENLAKAIESLPRIQMEPFDKKSILKAIEGTQNQIKEIEKAAKENPGEKRLGYELEKAQARIGLLQARLSTSDPQATSNVTKNALTIEHLSHHVKDDSLSMILSRISDDYPKMSKPEQKQVNELIRAMISKAQIVPMFVNENTTFDELENLLSVKSKNENAVNKKIDYVNEFETVLDTIIGEANDILSQDPEVRKEAVIKLNNLMKEHFPVGTNGMNAIESLRGIIDDPKLNDMFEQMGKENSDANASETIMAWIKENAPEVEKELSVSDIKTTEEEKIFDPEEGEHSLEEVAEFVKSLYDSTTGNFPRGETGVEISVQKKFGDHAVPYAKECIMTLKNSFDENMMRMRKLAGVS